MSAHAHRDNRATAAAVVALLEPELAAGGYELLDVRLFRGGGRVQIRVYVDLAAGGISLDEVAKASRTVGMLLEEADLFPEAYVIEVSSPGVRRPLRTPAHFAAAVGQRVDLKLAGAKSRLRGVLESAGPGGLVIVPAGGEEEQPAPVTVDPGSVLEANLDPDFDAQALINADRRRRKEDKRRKRRERPERRRGRPKRAKETDEPSEGS